MKWSTIGTTTVLLAAFAAALPASAWGSFPELLRRLPGDANALVVLNAEKIFSSPLAVREGWKQDYEKSFAAAPMLLPPSAQQFVLASKLGLDHNTASLRITRSRPLAFATLAMIGFARFMSFSSAFLSAAESSCCCFMASC